MIGLTLGRYFAWRFLGAVAGVFFTCFVLIAIVDFVELMRRASDLPNVSAAMLAMLSVLRIPALTEQIFPFAILFGAMASFFYLSRKLEFVVARAAGISAWQFLTPALVSAFILGLLAVTAYNPVSAALKEQALRLEAQTLGKEAMPGSSMGFWIRQRGIDGQAILHARHSSDRGVTLSGVTVYTFDMQGRFLERIEAGSALLESGAWKLQDAQLFQYGMPPRTHDTYYLTTSLTRDQVRESLSSPDTVSFWQLPEFIAAAEQAGLPAGKYRLQYQSLLARPFLMVAMVLVAATVSLRFFRLGGMARMVLYGVAAGFLLYVMGELAEDLGAANLLPAIVAAWLPAVFGIAMGSLVLLHQEDG